MILRKFNISIRALFGFSFIGSVMLFLGVFSLDQMAKIQAATEKIIQDSIPSIQAVNDLTRHTLQQRNLEYQLLLSTSRGAKEIL